ncbi:TetR/AcrR family transcriptional regulator [Caldimonas brevitalea]|uniref:Transcriptional regulator, TetR family n=1 Tax=Caldimonas brevitalea TaxID=413882 RepID=A0A0G3BH75_9BURK|nr:TetR/AcrR family transcriptional regulator [Caldimonas brevitalea]AKJ27313.1 transcriptional regulator, TetR family [Caldimonas brevitalea]
MPYAPEHKARTRSRIVESARRLFNRHGFEQVSIDQVMAEAGLTRGGFYHHFKSKDELYAEAVASYAARNPFAVKSAKAGERVADPRRLARTLVEMYLSDTVFDDVDQHCPLYALSTDVSRAGPEPQQAYTELIRGMTHVYRCALQGSRNADRRAKALVSLCVGGMVLARTTDDPHLRKSLRASARLEALALLEG